MVQLTTYLAYARGAEEAVAYYVSLFPDSRILQTVCCGAAGPGPVGSVLALSFELNGRRYDAMNSGSDFKFTNAISLAVECDTQEEIDFYWGRLVAGGEPSRCGWLKDRWGVSWQVYPRPLPGWITHPDPEVSRRCMQAMVSMSKLDLAALQAARDGR